MKESTSRRFAGRPRAIPPAIQVGDQRARILGLVEAHADHAIAVRRRAALDVRTQRLAETPFRLGALAVRRRRIPALALQAVLGEPAFDAGPAVQVLLGAHAPAAAHLKHVTRADPGGRPAVTALDEDDDAARLQALGQEARIGLAEAPALDAEIGHAARHQAVLIGVVHVVRLQARVGLEQTAAGLAAEVERLLGLVDLDAALAHRNEKGLRQPGRAERRGQMGQRAVGRADQDRRIAAGGKLSDHPAGGLFLADALELVRRHRLEIAAELVDLLPERRRQQVGADRERLQRRGQPEVCEVPAVQEGGERTQHRRGGIEIRQIVHPGRGHGFPTMPRAWGSPPAARCSGG